MAPLTHNNVSYNISASAAMAMANTKLHNSDHNEASPLLESSQPTQHRRPVGHRRTTSLASLHIPKAHRKRTILNLLLFGAFLASASSGFFSIPQTRLIEDALCHTYYGQRGGAPISEDECKVETVQSELAFVIAISSALDAAVSFVAAFPWSLAADRVGRQPILAIALSGEFCIFGVADGSGILADLTTPS